MLKCAKFGKKINPLGYFHDGLCSKGAWGFELLITVITVILFITLFFGLYFYWFSSPRNTLQITHENNIPVFDIPTQSNDKQVLLTKEQWELLISQIKDIKNDKNILQDNYLTVSTLNGFYSSLFAAMSIFLVILGVFGWKSISETRAKLDEFKKIENSVKLLASKMNYAEWIQEKIYSEKTKSSYQLDLTPEEEKKVQEMKDWFIKENQNNAWIQLMIAHQLVSNQNDLTEKSIEEADKIYGYIESEELFKNNSEVDPLIYHFHGALYKTKYDFLYKNRYKEEQKNIDANKCLESAKESYEKSLDLRTNEKEKRQTRSNLAVVWIELAKINKVLGKPYTTYLDEAKEQLNNVDKQLKKDGETDFNLYWDRARIAYLSQSIKEEDIKTLLRNAVDDIDSKKIFDRFIRNITEELDELQIDGLDKEELIIYVKEEFNKKKYLKL